MICMGVCIISTRNSGDDSIMMSETGKFERRSITERNVRIRSRSAASSTRTTRSEIVREVVFCYDFQRLFKYLPEFDGLVVRREQVVRCVLPSAPFDLVDLLFYF